MKYDEEEKLQVYTRKIISRVVDEEGNVIAVKTVWDKANEVVDLGSLKKPNKDIMEIAFVMGG